jgi:hypothetical protein
MGPGGRDAANEDTERLLICMQALSIKVRSAEWENAQLRERVDRLEDLIYALGEDVDNLHRWSHCHGTQAECAALRR